MLVYFLNAWADVCVHLLWTTHKDPEFQDWPVNNTQWMIVLLSIAFFYMICYLIHKLIEDWIKIYQIKHSASKYTDYNDNYYPDSPA
jgi:hypothetical protein